jgi:Ni2+-binding GTPase involved in maturation of urease and hydrogenase
MPGFAGQWPCAAKKHKGGDLNFLLLFVSRQKVMGPSGQGETKVILQHWPKLKLNNLNAFTNDFYKKNRSHKCSQSVQKAFTREHFLTLNEAKSCRRATAKVPLHEEK